MQLMTSPAPGISAFPSADGDLTQWRATLNGVDDTPYVGLVFKLSFNFPTDYPYKPPEVLFRTPIYHPNVDFSGRICLDILKSKWSAAYNIRTVLLSLQSLLGEPNKYVIHMDEAVHVSFSLTMARSDSPLNAEAAELWDKDPEEFKRKVLARHRDVDDD